MITPTKHMNLNLSVIKISSLIIESFKESEMIKYNELFNYIISKGGIDAKLVFLPSLNLLYLLDKISYDIKSDSFIFKK